MPHINVPCAKHASTVNPQLLVGVCIECAYDSLRDVRAENAELQWYVEALLDDDGTDTTYPLGTREEHERTGQCGTLKDAIRQDLAAKRHEEPSHD